MNIRDSRLVSSGNCQPVILTAANAYDHVLLFEIEDDQLPQIIFTNSRNWQIVNDLKAFLESARLLPDKVSQYDNRLMFQCLVIMLIEPGKAGVCLFFTQALTIVTDQLLVLAIELQRM